MAADVIRGVRNNARLLLTYASDGKLAVRVENSLGEQQPTKPEGSNAAAAENGGWPAYVYADGTGGSPVSGILRRDNGASTVRLWSRPIADTPNRFSAEFQDIFNEYQQDSFAIVDAADAARTGQEITGRVVADGIPTYDQAARALKFLLDKSVQGNRYLEFETTVKALGQRVGDLIAVTYGKEGLVNQPFRILKIAPGTNYRTVRITAQIHNDAWYQDTNGQLTLIPETRRQPGVGEGLPNPLSGAEVADNGLVVFGITELQVTGTDGTILSEVEVEFTPPVAGQSRLAGIPILSLQAAVSGTGGTITENQTLYYAVTATDAGGLESGPSFTVRAKVPAGSNTNSVTLNGLSFTAGTASFNVYRGAIPTKLHRIAAAQGVASQFTDTGFEPELVASPDPQYEHANFYWRLEETEEKFATIIGPDSVGDTSLTMEPGKLVGHLVRLVEGQGEGQERTIVANTATTVTVARAWDEMPDAATHFVVSEAAWHFGGRARSSPARFEIPNLRERVVQITGRAANAANIESPEALALVTRWRIGGGGTGVADNGPPPAASFGTSAHADGVLRFQGIAFPELANTQGITSGTFILHYRDELQGVSTVLLAADADASQTTLTLNPAGNADPGDLIQIEREILHVTAVGNGGLEYTVERGYHVSTAAAHAAGAPVYKLQTRTLVVPFEKRFFATAASGSWVHAEWLPNIRMASAEFYVTNDFGPGPVTVGNYMQFTDAGQRTLHGGQLNFQIEGILGILDDAAPPLSAQESFSIRDVYATVKAPPEGAGLQVQVRQGGDVVAACTIVAGQTVSTAVNGAELPVLAAGATLSLDLLAVGTSYPGRDLTVTIRL
jgi:hypothetical protein